MVAQALPGTETSTSQYSKELNILLVYVEPFKCKRLSDDGSDSDQTDWGS